MNSRPHMPTCFTRMNPSQRSISTLFADIRTHASTTRTLRMMYAMRKIFPMKKNSNKFVVGGVIEEAFTRLIRQCGRTCTNVSSTEARIDILVRDGEIDLPFSLKSIQTLGSQITLENYRGQRRPITELAPTIFLVFEKNVFTLAYMDNDILLASGVPPETIYAHSDSNLSMRGGFVKRMVREGLPRELVLELPVPEIPDFPEQDNSVILMDYVERIVA